MNLLLVAPGGSIGAGGRHPLGGWLHLRLGNGFPWGTFAVNALGSSMIWPIFGLARSKAISPDTTLFLTVGVPGGFTTFSHQTMRLLANGSVGASFLNVAGQFAVGLLTVYAAVRGRRGRLKRSLTRG